MLFTMSMNVILHEALLMVILLMPLPLIKEWFLLIKMISLFDWLAPRPKCFKNHVTKNPKLFQDTPDLAEDFDSPICLACTMAKNFNDYYWYKLVSLQCYAPWRFLLNVINWQKMTMLISLVFGDWFFWVSMMWPKGWSKI